MISGVYKIRNKINGKFYIGSSVDIEKRFWRHHNDLIKGIHHCIYLQRAWDKNGEDQFEFVVEKVCKEHEARRIEQEILDQKYGSIYNTSRMAGGGDLISYHPNRDLIVKRIGDATREFMDSLTDEERIQKFARKGSRNGMFGRKHTEAVKKKISQLNKGNRYAKGAIRSEKFRKRLSEIASQRTGEKNPFYGKRHSDETKRKNSEKHKGLKPVNMKKVQIDEVVYESLTEASRQLNVVPATILYRIRSKSEKYKTYRYIE